MNIGYFLLFWGWVVILHELGHYIGFRIFNQIPDINLNWYGISIGENCIHKMYVLQLYLVLMLGVGFGFMPIIFSLNDYNLILYLLMSSIDIMTIFHLTNIEKRHLNKKLWQIQYDILKEQKKKYGV